MHRRTILVSLISAVFGVLLLAGFAGAGDEPNAEVPKEIPADARKIKNPEEADTESLEHGQLLFSSQCTMCHGAKGDGTGDLVERLGYEMPDFTDAGQQKSRTDGELYFVLSRGHGKMRGQQGRLDDKARWDLVNYVRSFAPAE